MELETYGTICTIFKSVHDTYQDEGYYWSYTGVTVGLESNNKVIIIIDYCLISDKKLKKIYQLVGYCQLNEVDCVIA